MEIRKVVRVVCTVAAVTASIAPVAIAAGAPAPSRIATPGGPIARAAGASPCNYYYEWIGKLRFPLQADPHATYTYVAVSKKAARRRMGFLVRGQFIHGAWTSWLTYARNAKPFSGANFVGGASAKPVAASAR